MAQRRMMLAATNSQAALWTPAQITTALWLDAADASTITTVSGAVSQWNDKSGNGRNATQSTSANRPANGSVTQNGLNAISFDGVNDQLIISPTIIIGPSQQDFGVFACYKAKVSSSGYGSLFGNFDGSNGQFDLYVGGSPAYVTPWGIYLQASVDVDPGTYTQNQNWIIAATRTSNVIRGFTNGSKKNSINNSGSVAGGLVSQWRIGNNAGAPLPVDLYEIICVNGTVSDATTDTINGYFAWKWDLQANLASDHPYKSAAPTA